MKLNDPIKILIAIVAVNAILLAAATTISSQIAELLGIASKTAAILLCGSCFVSTSLLSTFLAKKLIANYIEPAESNASKLIAITGENLNLDISQLTDKVVEELENSRQRERLIADYSSDILCCLDEDRRFRDLNVQSEAVWDYPMLSLLATPAELLLVEEEQAAFIAFLDAVRSENSDKAFECRIRTRSGELIDLEWQAEWSHSLKCYFCLAKNITDRKENQRLKAEITAMVGHDLRAPVTSLSFLLENLSTGTFGAVPERADAPIARAKESVKQMLGLIDQLLDAEKLEGGELEVDLKIVPLSEVYEQCANLLTDFAGKKDITVNFPDSSEMAVADFDRCCQILSNLLSNAIKWSMQNSTIEVIEKPDKDWLTISVVDRGPGIPESRRSMIFERFKSRENTGAEKIVGSTGLGLYLAKKLTELQGGQIGFTTKVGEGTTFWFTLKRASEADLPGYLD